MSVSEQLRLLNRNENRWKIIAMPRQQLDRITFPSRGFWLALFLFENFHERSRAVSANINFYDGVSTTHLGFFLNV